MLGEAGDGGFWDWYRWDEKNIKVKRNEIKAPVKSKMNFNLGTV